jgi:DNA-directed RNA polymerase subunit F
VVLDPERFRRLEELYHQARECASEDRAAFLARIDPELRNDLQSLLEQAKLSGPLEQPALEVAARLLGGALPWADCCRRFRNRLPCGF